SKQYFHQKYTVRRERGRAQQETEHLSLGAVCPAPAVIPDPTPEQALAGSHATTGGPADEHGPWLRCRRLEPGRGRSGVRKWRVAWHLSAQKFPQARDGSAGSEDAHRE